MRRAAMLVLVLGAAVCVAVWWTPTGEDPVSSRGFDGKDARDTDPTLAGRTRRDGNDAPAPDDIASPVVARSGAARRLAAATDRLRAVRAAYEAGVAYPTEVSAAERELWLARAEAGEVSEQEAYAEIARLDARTLAYVETLLEVGRSSHEAVWYARVRWHQSKRRAGDVEERFEERRAQFLQFVQLDHAARLQAGLCAPEHLHRRVLDVCREFPLEAGTRDLALERAGAALRDDLLADLQQLRARDAEGEGFPPGERQTALELELWDLRLFLQEVDFRTAHAEKARIYERVVRDLESRQVGVLSTAGDLAAARLRVHREKFLLDEDDQDYVRMREQVLRGERQRLDALVSNGRLSEVDRETALRSLRAEFPPADVLRASKGETSPFSRR